MLPQQAAVGSAMMEQMKETPMYKSYVAIAPHPEEFPKLLDQMGAYMRKSYDWSGDVKKLTMPTMLVYGDSDMIRPEHIVKIYQLLGGGLKDAGWQREHMAQNRLAILPNVTHYEMGVAPQMVEAALPFLNGYAKAKTWTSRSAAPSKHFDSTQGRRPSAPPLYSLVLFYRIRALNSPPQGNKQSYHPAHYHSHVCAGSNPAQISFCRSSSQPPKALER